MSRSKSEARARQSKETKEEETRQSDGGAGDAGRYGDAGAGPLLEGDGGLGDSRAASSDGGAPDDPDGNSAELPYEHLVLYLPMEEREAWGGADASNGGEIEDVSSQNNHGVAHGDAHQFDEGKFGKGARFEGKGWLQVTDDDSLHGESEVTLSAWIRPEGYESGSDSYGILSKRAGYDDKTSYGIWLDYAGHLSSDIVQSDTRLTAPDPVTPKKWTHVASVYNGHLPDEQRLRLYINGKLVAVGYEVNESIPEDFDADVRIGDLPEGGQPFRGEIDEVTIWTRALSAAAIDRLAKATSPLPREVFEGAAKD